MHTNKVTHISSPRDRLIVALDVYTRTEALRLMAELQPFVGLFKIGNQLFTACGPSLVQEMIATGARIFLDLKYHDIPNTVANAVVAAMRLGVSICNIHALGGLEMMKRASQTCQEVATRENLARPLLLAVTLLTSHDQASIREIGIEDSLSQSVVRLARLSAQAGMDGVVAAAHEINLVREVVPTPFVILTPGLRPASSDTQDQKRVMTPQEALQAGADYLVVGRPIIAHPQPALAAAAILADLDASKQEV